MSPEVYNVPMVEKALAQMPPEALKRKKGGPTETKRKRIERFLEYVKRNGNIVDGMAHVSVTYAYSRAYRCGRRYACSPSLQTLPKICRGSAVESIGAYDVDMIVAHYSLVWWIATKYFQHPEACVPTIKEYVENRESVTKAAAAHFRSSEEQAKDLFRRLLYGGSVNTWMEDNDIPRQEQRCGVVEKLVFEARLVSYTLSAHYPGILEIAREEKRDNPFFTTMSYVVSSIEDEALGCLEQFPGIRPNGLLFDGFACVPESGVMTDEVLRGMEAHVRAKTGIHISLATKPWPALPNRPLACQYLRSGDITQGPPVIPLLNPDHRNACLPFALKNILSEMHAHNHWDDPFLPFPRLAELDAMEDGPWSLKQVAEKFPEMDQITDRMTAQALAGLTSAALIIETPIGGLGNGHAVGVRLTQSDAHFYDSREFSSWSMPLRVLDEYLADAQRYGADPPFKLIGIRKLHPGCHQRHPWSEELLGGTRAGEATPKRTPPCICPTPLEFTQIIGRSQANRFSGRRVIAKKRCRMCGSRDHNAGRHMRFGRRLVQVKRQKRYQARRWVNLVLDFEQYARAQKKATRKAHAGWELKSNRGPATTSYNISGGVDPNDIIFPSLENSKQRHVLKIRPKEEEAILSDVRANAEPCRGGGLCREGDKGLCTIRICRRKVVPGSIFPNTSYPLSVQFQLVLSFIRNLSTTQIYRTVPGIGHWEAAARCLKTLVARIGKYQEIEQWKGLEWWGNGGQGRLISFEADESVLKKWREGKPGGRGGGRWCSHVWLGIMQRGYKTRELSRTVGEKRARSLLRKVPPMEP